MRIYDQDPSSSRRRIRSDFTEGERKKQRTDLKPEFTAVDYKNNHELIESLLSMNTDNHVPVILVNRSQVKLVYNHERVVKFFELRMWVSASEDNQLRKSQRQIYLQGVLAGERFLLVLDDVWGDNLERQMFLQTVSLRSGKGSKILLNGRDTQLIDLPDQILQNIFSRLPVSSVLSCKCVCKSWVPLISDQEFAKTLFSKSSICPLLRTYEPRCWPRELHMIDGTTTDELVPFVKLCSQFSLPKHTTAHQAKGLWFPKFGVVNSCNGLICVCTVPFNNPLYVCNPITGEYITLPEPVKIPKKGDFKIVAEHEGRLSMTGFVLSGFGFCPGTEQYKVMRILELVTKTVRDLLVQVFIVGSDTSWRSIGSLLTYGNIGIRLQRRDYIIRQHAHYKPSFPVYLNGSMHWVCNRFSSPMFIDSFDFELELFQEILPPPHFGLEQKGAIRNMTLGILGGCLYVSDVTSYTHFDLWVMKEYNNDASWTKELVIDTISLNIWPRGLYRPIKYLDNGDLLMFHLSNALVCYNPTKKSFRYFKIRGISSDFEMIPYVPSLISMRDSVKLENPQVQITHARNIENKAMDWEEFDDFKLVEEDKDTISASYSRIVEGTLSFKEAITNRHWEDHYN